MNERSPSLAPIDEGELDFRGFELRALYNDVREYQRLLNETTVSPDEKWAILAELDGRWPYYGELLSVTGNIATIERSDEQDDETGVRYAPKTRFVEDQPVVSLGFNIYDEPVYVEDELVAQQTRVGLFFHLANETIMSTMLLEQNNLIRGVAGIDDVIIEFPSDPMSGIVSRVSYFFPEITEDIDRAMLNSGDESEAVMALREVTLTTGPHVTRESLNPIEQYVNSLAEFDNRVPYQFAFADLFYLAQNDENPDELTPCTTDMIEFWGYPIGIEVIPYAYPENGTLGMSEDTFVFGLRVEALAREQAQDQGRTFLVPITERFYMSSVRADHYANRQVA